ncbi:LysR substrate-binding domain-containing protein [Pseudomonas sp. PH1b]|uniref:LysR substrate-binding domain-containing protein n=1 Tax=Pseudomonas sp. PH1b TaxID=1397282 RepID=UPI0004693C39|nr:LysR substrate-binding domain-containing protein [Pseudomonas sp. PH1b]
MVETRLLRQFIVVAEELHFHRAAARLHMAQPPLSQAISRLEARLGFGLFDRNRRGVALTAAGTAFLATARGTLEHLAQGIEQARNVSLGMAGTLTVSSISIACYPTLLDALRRFREERPKVRLQLRELPSASQAQALLSGEVDVALMRHLPLPEPTIVSRRILAEPIVLALPVEHPGAQAGAVDLKDFATQDFVFTPRDLGSGYHDQLLALCADAGFIPRVVQQAAQIHTLVSLVACGFGVALVPESMARSVRQDKVAFRPLRPMAGTTDSSLGLYLNWRQDNHSPQLQHLLGLLAPAAVPAGQAGQPLQG